MAGFAEILAPFAFFVPLMVALPSGMDRAGPEGENIATKMSATASCKAPPGFDPEREPAGVSPPLDALALIGEHQVAAQIRIQQRVIIRIAPQRGRNRQTLLAQMPQRARDQRFEERKAGKCLPVQGIAGVETGSGNRLILFMSDARMISLNLEKGCHARDFYSGFYIERNEDGQLCVDRDRLLARSGAKCQVDRMAQLVEVGG